MAMRIMQKSRHTTKCGALPEILRMESVSNSVFELYVVIAVTGWSAV